MRHKQDRITERDLMEALARYGLRVTRELKGWRGVDGRNGDRRLYWSRSKRGLPGAIDFAGFDVSHPAVERVYDNGNVRGRIRCAAVDRRDALGIIEQAIRRMV